LINEIVAKEAYKLANGQCLVCGRKHSFSAQVLDKTYELHHIYWKSEYKGIDRDEAWNLALVCFSQKYGWDCHKSGPNAPHNNKTIDRNLKFIADLRKPLSLRGGGTHSDIISKRKVRKNAYKERIDKFKKSHNGKTPYQIAYLKQKEIMKIRQQQKNKTFDNF